MDAVNGVNARIAVVFPKPVLCAQRPAAAITAAPSLMSPRRKKRLGAIIMLLVYSYQ